MELRHLEAFVAVARERSFTRAAARLHRVQSGVSASVAALERELHASLLTRTSRRVELTDAGSALLPRAVAALDAARDARDAVHAVGAGLQGTLRIGSMISVGLLDLPVLLGHFRREHPGVFLSVATAPASGSHGLVEALTDGRLDLAFVSLPGRAPAGVRLRGLTSSPLDLLVRADHELASAPTVTLAQLADHAFIDFPVGFGNRAVADRAFAVAGLQRRVAVEITDIATCAGFVREGFGVALLPRFATTTDGDLVARPVTGADLLWPLALATSSTRSPSAAARALDALVDQHVPRGAAPPR